MLLELFRSLGEHYSHLTDLSFRAFMSALTALVLGFVLGPWLIGRLRAMHFGQAVRQNGPKSHLVKQGTPTMGGVLILFSIAVSTLLWGDLGNRFIWVVLGVTLGYGAIGWIDDYRKVVYRDPNGMSAREKFGWQSVIALVAGFYLVFALAVPADGTLAGTISNWIAEGFPLTVSTNLDLFIPFLGSFAFPLGFVGFLVFVFVVIVGSSNAVNLTDGLDGLAILPSVLVGTALGVFCWVVGLPGTSSALAYTFIPGAEEVFVIAAALLGAGLAFLWFNAHPAQVFMGDVGALAIGGGLGTMAVVCRQEIVLAVMGAVFVMETVSVMMQTVYYRLSGGKRIFRMAPIHHHFELGGWAETQVVVRFWIITIVLVGLGLSTLRFH